MARMVYRHHDQIPSYYTGDVQFRVRSLPILWSHIMIQHEELHLRRKGLICLVVVSCEQVCGIINIDNKNENSLSTLPSYDVHRHVSLSRQQWLLSARFSGWGTGYNCCLHWSRLLVSQRFGSLSLVQRRLLAPARVGRLMLL